LPAMWIKKLETLAFLSCLIRDEPLALFEIGFWSRVLSLASRLLDIAQIAVVTGNQVNTNVIINK
jgi:hypothetical protein